MSFDRALRFAMKWETGDDFETGGLVDHPNDPGGLTKWGISQHRYPGLDIAGLTYDQAAALYRTDFWPEVGGDDLPPLLAVAMFDYGIHSGPARAVRALQRELGPAAGAADGVWGPRTRAALRSVVGGRHYREESDRRLAQAVTVRRADRLVRLALGDASGRYDPFLVGWMRRTHDLVAHVCGR